MEPFWFFRLRFRRAYDSAYDSNFRFSLGRKHSYDSDYDSDSGSVASENQPLETENQFQKVLLATIATDGEEWGMETDYTCFKFQHRVSQKSLKTSYGLLFRLREFTAYLPLQVL